MLRSLSDSLLVGGPFSAQLPFQNPKLRPLGVREYLKHGHKRMVVGGVLAMQTESLAEQTRRSQVRVIPPFGLHCLGGRFTHWFAMAKRKTLQPSRQIWRDVATGLSTIRSRGCNGSPSLSSVIFFIIAPTGQPS